MLFSEFVKEMQKDLDGFEKRWKSMQAKKPEHYPNELGEGDWLEQFIIYLEEDKR